MLELAMLFNVSGLIQDGIGSTRRHQIDDTFVNTSGKRERVSGEIEMLNIKDGVLVRAELDVLTDELCSRCLRALDETLRLSFEEEFLATVDVRSGHPVDELPDPETFRIDENHLLDLTE